MRELRLPDRRSNRNLADDAAYIASIAEQLDHIAGHLTPATRVLDFGCGQGRLLNGLLAGEHPFASYLGVDLDPASIAWCCANLSYPDVPAAFAWYNGRNARYNAAGHAPLAPPIPDASFDLAFSSSVFTHLDRDDAGRVAGLLARALAPDGLLYATAFVEDGVPEVTINPEGYLGSLGAADTALHWVRFERGAFLAALAAEGLVEVDPAPDPGTRRIARSGQHWMTFRRMP